MGFERIIEEKGGSLESGVGSQETKGWKNLNNRTGMVNDEGFRLEMLFLVRADLRSMEKNAQ
jgi:hypothetical protein